MRRPFVNLSDYALKKTMVSLTDPLGQNYIIVAIIYQFTGEEHPVTVNPMVIASVTSHSCVHTRAPK